MELHNKLTTTFNSRSLGGMKTKDGGSVKDVLFRSDALDQLDTNGEKALEQLNIGTVVDMRTDEESSRAQDKLPHDVTLVSLPMAGGAMNQNVKKAFPQGMKPEDLTQEQIKKLLAKIPTLDELYAGILADDNKQFAQFAQEIIKASKTDTPGVLWHCTAGKDRTGLAAALLLTLAGVDQKDVVKDYTETQKYTKGEFADKLTTLVTEIGAPLTAQIKELCLDSPAGAIESALKYIDENHGSVEEYFKDAGLSEDQLTQLKEAIVEY